MHKQRLENLGLSSCGSRSLWRDLVSGSLVSGVALCWVHGKVARGTGLARTLRTQWVLVNVGEASGRC